jgi:stearoyl-CoA desaturase (delta-9 desaturase)
MSAQGPVLEWCAMHREHHKHSDRDGDPHSPHLHGTGLLGMLKGMCHAHFGWLFADEPAGAARAVPDLVEDPVLRFVDRYFWVWMLGGWLLPAAIGGALADPGSWSWAGALTGFLWGGLVRTFLLHHVTWSINSVCHFMGTRRFAVDDESRNVFWLALPSLGEAWHHNHHAFPRAAVQGLRRFELDPSGWLVRGMRRLGLAWNVVEIGPERQQERLASSAPARSRPQAATR